jgi:CheY-like chemotaxis protein
MLLDFDGHIVTEARDGKDALERYEPGRFDLVITDYFMPRMRGDELATKVKELAPSQLILMVTGSAEKLGGPHAPVDGILRKPFFLEGLRQAVAHLFCPVVA